MPDPGDTFEIITNISGDGNDVTLTAQKSTNPNPSEIAGKPLHPKPNLNQNRKQQQKNYLLGSGLLVLITLFLVFLRKPRK